MAPRVKVKRAELIKVVDGRLRKLNADHERKVAAYPDEVAKYQQLLVAALRRAADQAEKGKWPKDRYGSQVTVEVGMSKPSKPSRTSRDACNLERLLKTLKIGADEALSLAVEDADLYFGPCGVNGDLS